TAPRSSAPEPRTRASEFPAATARHSEEPRSSVRSTPSPKPETDYSSSSRSVSREDSRGRQSESRDQNPHVYYPKTSRQSSEIRSTPQSERRQATPSQSSDSGRDSRDSR